jgi:hypothetical protein
MPLIAPAVETVVEKQRIENNKQREEDPCFQVDVQLIAHRDVSEYRKKYIFCMMNVGSAKQNPDKGNNNKSFYSVKNIGQRLPVSCL